MEKFTQIQNGILLIDKEAGITSYDVIRKLKQYFPKGQKIGHAGTLDPFATGLLVILLGKFTKKSLEIMRMHKSYTVTAEFGYETDTHDPTGNRVAKDDELDEISENEIEEALEKFRGKIKQTPPDFSAKRVKGKRAYDLARQGKNVKLEPREIEIYRLEQAGHDWPRVKFEVECSKGTYVRTLVVDLAQELGTYATPIELRRTKIGKYDVKDAVGSDKLSKDDLSLVK